MITLQRDTGKTVWLDPEAIIAVEELYVPKEGEDLSPTCRVYVGIHCLRVVGSIEEVMEVVCGS